LFAIIWIGWIVSWMAAALWSGRTEKRAPALGGWAYSAAIVIGALLLLHSARRLLNETRLWHVGYGGAYALAAMTLAGIMFAWWARIHLGRLWSGAITRKEGHRVIDSGPYALVRHPIYNRAHGRYHCDSGGPGNAERLDRRRPHRRRLLAESARRGALPHGRAWPRRLQRVSPPGADAGAFPTQRWKRIFRA
jgi:hypothetical protein